MIKTIRSSINPINPNMHSGIISKGDNTYIIRINK